MKLYQVTVTGSFGVLHDVVASQRADFAKADARNKWSLVFPNERIRTPKADMLFDFGTPKLPYPFKKHKP